MSDENVVLFPGMKMPSPPQSLDEVRALIKGNKQEFVDGIASDMTNYILTELQNFGYTFSSDDIPFVSSVHLFHESIRAILMRVNGIEHDLHAVAEEMYGEEATENQFLVDMEAEVE